MIETYLVYDDINQVKKVEDANITSSTFHFLNSKARSSMKAAFALKSHWAARKDPFAIIMDGNKAIKAFYSETGQDVIEQLINYLRK